MNRVYFAPRTCSPQVAAEPCRHEQVIELKGKSNNSGELAQRLQLLE